MKATKKTNRDALGRTPAEREAFIRRLSGVIHERETREGIARLMASPLMTSAEGREDNFTGALDAVSDARSDAGPRIRDLGLDLEGNVPGVIEDLGFALLLHRLTAKELFRLGTSKEAMDLFEESERRHLAARAKVRAMYPNDAGGAS